MSRQLRILLVDDEAHIVELVQARLQNEGFEVLIARDGQQALKIAQAELVDLIILDIMLPKLNGYEVCTMLKQDARYLQIPILMFTAKSQENDMKLGRECGADAYMCKPFETQVLLDHIRTLTGHLVNLGKFKHETDKQ